MTSAVHQVGIRFNLDVTGLKTEAQAGGQALAAMGQRGEQAAKQATAALDHLPAQAAAIPPAVRAVAESFDQVSAKAQQAAQQTHAAMNSVAATAGQTRAAMRMLPAQITDIAVGLSTGQSPFTVLLQQGGQLKDMFGGIGPAAGALGGYVASLINPLTLAAAAIGVLGAAYYSASQRAQEFSTALINSGNYVGQSAGQLNELAKAVSSTIGTQGQAADVLAALAGSGRIAGESLRSAGEAVVAQNKVMGTSIEEAAGQFIRLGEEPTKASAKLNESLHYLNQTTYDRIRALEDQGRQEEAAALAQSAYASATLSRMQQVQEQAGILSKSLSGLKGVALGMWEVVSGALSSIGAQQAAAGKLVDAQRKAAFLKTNGSAPEALAAAQSDVTRLSRGALRQQENAFAEGERVRSEAAKISASDRIKTLSNEVRTNADRRKKALTDLDRDFKTLGKASSGPEYDKLVSNINEKFKDQKGVKARDTSRLDARAQAKLDIEGYQAKAVELLAVNANAERVLEAQRAAGLADESAYYARKKELVQ